MRKYLACALIGVSFLIGLFALVMDGLDLAEALALGTETPSIAGFKAGLFIGIILRTIILGAAALALYFWARGILNPGRFSAVAIERDLLRQAYHREGLDTKQVNVSGCDVDYASCSNSDLLSVYETINREKQPARFLALLAAIKQRVEKD